MVNGGRKLWWFIDSEIHWPSLYHLLLLRSIKDTNRSDHQLIIVVVGPTKTIVGRLDSLFQSSAEKQ